MSDKINQSKSNVIGDQIAGDKISNNFYNTILNDSENIDEFTDDFNNFLDKTELHSISIYKELKFNDLYIPIDLNNNNLDKINIEDLYLDFIVNPKNIIIYGNEISGKTSALKYLINNLKNDYTIIYTDDVHNIQLPIKNFILNKKKQIYKKYSNKKSTILFIDNLHKLSNDKIRKILVSSKNVNDLYIVVTVDNVFIDDIKSKDLMKDFELYKIKSMGYSLIDQLIEKWLRLNNVNENILLKEKDKYIDKLDRIILKSILPRYPFFIYTILSEINNNNNIDPNITSHGHCYQTLIYLSLYKVNVPDELIDSYYNVLTELSFYFYKNYIDNKSYEIHKDDIIKFLDKEYEYKIQEDIDKILNNLNMAKLLTISSCGYYKFEYQYIYYFYLGRYFAENINDNRNILYDMINNLDNVENAYIIIFLIHHTKDKDILTYLQISMMCYYDNDNELTLNHKEIEKIEEYNQDIFNFVFNKNIDPNENRKKLLIKKDILEEEELKDETEYQSNYEKFDDSLIKMRKALKSIEVMGHILNSRHGSIKIKELSEYIEFSMKLLFRIAGNLFSKLQEDKNDFINYYYNELKDENEINNREKLLIAIKKLIFNYSILVILSTIKRCTKMILSDKLISFIEDYNKDDNKRTPLTVLIEKDVKMTYDKTINFKKLENYLNDKNIDDLLKNIYKFLVKEYLYYNNVSGPEKQKILSICNFKEIKK